MPLGSLARPLTNPGRVRAEANIVLEAVNQSPQSVPAGQSEQSGL